MQIYVKIALFEININFLFYNFFTIFLLYDIKDKIFQNRITITKKCQQYKLKIKTMWNINKMKIKITL